MINATTGFLTAKGTEAGALLSTILANANAGLQGVLNETEKTTVKVTRTLTEQIMSGGQLTEITKVITPNEAVPHGQNIQDIIKGLSAGQTVTTTGSSSETTKTEVKEKHESLAAAESDEKDLVDRAEQVVSKVVSSAVERVMDEESKVESRENVKIEEESSVKISTTKIILNGENGADLDQVQSEFYKHGKQEAEEVVKKLEESGVEREEATKE